MIEAHERARRGAALIGQDRHCNAAMVDDFILPDHHGLCGPETAISTSA